MFNFIFIPEAKSHQNLMLILINFQINVDAKIDMVKNFFDCMIFHEILAEHLQEYTGNWKRECKYFTLLYDKYFRAKDEKFYKKNKDKYWF